ncbi:hypothetical protein KAT84_03495, partial [Candidatus Bipolaricaulota bacterium]|nr:hypothetical protein [Candidatus Bipolaricaulota bacterium]
SKNSGHFVDSPDIATLRIAMAEKPVWAMWLFEEQPQPVDVSTCWGYSKSNDQIMANPQGELF